MSVRKTLPFFAIYRKNGGFNQANGGLPLPPNSLAPEG